MKIFVFHRPPNETSLEYKQYIEELLQQLDICLVENMFDIDLGKQKKKVKF
jgi:hypothetical protein